MRERRARSAGRERADGESTPEADGRIRPARRTDLAEIVRIEQAAFRPEVAERAEALEWRLRGCPELFFVYLRAGRVIGYISGLRLDAQTEAILRRREDGPQSADAAIYRQDGRTLFIRSLAIAPESQGAGAGRALLERLMRAGERLGCARILLLAEADHAEYYARFGFSRTSDYHRFQGGEFAVFDGKD